MKTQIKPRPIKRPIDLITAKEAAAILNRDLQTLATWRSKKMYLPWQKIGGKVFYRKSDIERFLEKGYMKVEGD